ncbi:MAG: ribbon-helix-helix protein, CopG family [Candidatus Acidiferrales bacterium]
MPALVSARVGEKTRRRFTRIARRKRVSTSHALREAINDWMERQETEESFYDKVAHLVGVVRGGDPKRSENGGRKFAEFLKARRGRD